MWVRVGSYLNGPGSKSLIFNAFLMALLRFDPKVNNLFIEAGWPKSGSVKRDGISVRLVQKLNGRKLVLVRKLGNFPYDKERLSHGVQVNVPELGELLLSYRKVLALIPLVSMSVNGEKLKGSEVLNSPLGEIAYHG
jgi:hypothetical protein